LPALALCPEWLLEPGAALSFAAVLGIATLGPRISWTQPLATLGTSRGGRWLILPIWVGTAAQLGCLPILATTFHQVSPWGVPSAPLAIPVAALTVAATLLGLVLHVLVPALGALILEGAGVAAELLIVAARWGAAHLPPPWPVPSPAAAHWVLLVAGAGLLRAARDAPPAGRQHHVRALGGLLCLVVASGCLLAGAPALDQEPLARARLELLDVGQGDAAVLLLEGRRGWLARTGLRPPGRAAVLIDAGDARLGFDAGRRVVVPRLCALGLRRLTGVIASHAHRDHAGGLPAVLAALPVATLWVPPGFEALPPLAAALTRHPATTVRRATRGERIPLHPEIDVRVLHPPAGYRGTTNDRSLVVALTLPGCALLLTGDVEARGERAMLARAGLVEHCDVLKVAHHGSATSSTGAWLAAVGARHALVSVGAGNRHGHPDPAVVARLSAAGARLWRTDRDGAVVISIEHGGYRVESVIDQAAEPRRAR
ncbi:MAG: ComEC/Rec2 family competence protein, partial [Candidatus Eiseniibacteriota bacterium]|jgi:competence protein ComEC